MTSSGNEGCKCMDQSSALASLQDRDCTTFGGQQGVQLNLGGSCVSYDYGSNACLLHDLLHDPKCQGDLSTTTVPPYCFQAWCYVDANSCKKNSVEKVYKSEYFTDQNIYYSYSTCNATNLFHVDSLSVVGGIGLTSTVPTFQYPMLNKQLPDGTFVYDRPDNDVYMDDSLPFGGVYIDYVNSLVEISNGDIQNVSYTHTSKASLMEYPRSSFTAAVQDVENGLVDMAVGPFWITGQRLKMTTFTVPLLYDKTVLVIPKPGQKSSLAYEVQKVLEPFTYGLWGVLIAVTMLAALLSVWFSDREMIAKRDYRAHLSQQQKKSHKSRKGIYLRLILDAMLEKGMFFFSAGIEQDVGASLPHKVLMFGFGFFILIAVSAYVANLAAFLTQSGLETGVGTMKEVIDGNIAICGHPALEEEIRLKWPAGKWLFPDDGFSGPNGMFEAYERGDCEVLAVGREDTIMNRDVESRVCENNLVYTESVVTENPIAFPIRPQLASAFSYWMYLGEKSYGVNIEDAKTNFIEKNEIKALCEVELSNLSMEEVDDFARVSPQNMFLPIMAFLACAFTAVILQLIHENKRKKGLTSSIGRKSTLNLYDNPKSKKRGEKVDDDEWVMPRAKSIAQRQSLNDSGPDCDERRVRISFSDTNSGASTTGDNFNETPQSTHEPKSILKGSMDNIPVDNGVAEIMEEGNDISSRITKLEESGVLEEVLDCFEFFQEMKKLKKDQ